MKSFNHLPTDLFNRMLQQRIELETQIATIKTTFEHHLKKRLALFKVSAPLFVDPITGLNDDLNGTERPVTFPVKFLNDKPLVIVHSLAKWKRRLLQKLDVQADDKINGIVTDMRAIRADEDYSPLHSIYVDQWDWEKVISERSLSTFKSTVQQVYQAIIDTQSDCDIHLLPGKITFISALELCYLYPDCSPKEREDAICKKYGAVCLMGIGYNLKGGLPHDGRAIDYDDWSTLNDGGFNGLNGDILVWNEATQSAFELSSMGIRVDAHALKTQARIRHAEDKINTQYHQDVLDSKMPMTIGGGIGQSRLVMFLLQKSHIGQVQASVWPDQVTKPELL